jgi:hypothetical protein
MAKDGKTCLTRVANVRFPRASQLGAPGCCLSAKPFRRVCSQSGVRNSVNLTNATAGDKGTLRLCAVINTGCIDFVLSPEDIAKKIVHIAQDEAKSA